MEKSNKKYNLINSKDAKDEIDISDFVYDILEHRRKVYYTLDMILFQINMSKFISKINFSDKSVIDITMEIQERFLSNNIICSVYINKYKHVILHIEFRDNIDELGCKIKSTMYSKYSSLSNIYDYDC